MAGDWAAINREPWTKESRDYALAGLSVLREYFAGGVEYGVQDAMVELYRRVKEFGGSNDMDGLASVAAGLIRSNAMLLEWIQYEADNRQLLLEDVRRRLPDYEEPDTYPHKPQWSTWDGVLREMESNVRNSPTTD